MKYNIDLNDNDYIEFNYSYLKHSKIGKYSLLVTRISFPFAMFIFVLALLIIDIERGLVLTVAAVAVLSTVLWWFIVPAMMRWNIKKNIIKIKKDGKLPYNENASVEFLDDRIVETCEQGETIVKYSDIVNIYDEKDYFYIFYGSMQAFILPERCIGDSGFIKS
jgi:hypothetical protein